MIQLEGDSAEYEFITEAINLSKDVGGLVVELGTRRGMGVKTMVDAVRQFCPDKIVVSVDPYGHLEYEHREGQMTRLDYTNQMKLEGMAAIYSYLCANPVNYIFFNMTDTRFFEQCENGIEVYDIETTIVNKYSFAHLDGPHGGKALIAEAAWFTDRMDVGATMVIDDISIDFCDMEPVDLALWNLGWERIKVGNKKAIYIKTKSVPHELISKENIIKWGYVPSVGNAYVNWNGVWIREVNGVWEYGNPNHHTIDETHQFIKKGEVQYLDELNDVQNSRGLERKIYTQNHA